MKKPWPPSWREPYSFTAIHSVNARTIDRLQPGFGPTHTLDDLLELDRMARVTARQVMQELAA